MLDRQEILLFDLKNEFGLFLENSKSDYLYIRFKLLHWFDFIMIKIVTSGFALLIMMIISGYKLI